ncbi:MAG: polyprenyl synthetase family protein [Alphaproteobacteria bacterium]|nr:polyprenyl synthetase family protein [Alphaproteobacteria bacterium]
MPQAMAAAADTPPPGTALDRLRDLVLADLNKVNLLIVERMQSPVALIPRLASHIVAAGGKRLRPLLTLATARLFDYTGEQHIHLATSVEFIHTATLLHDDVVDESDLRRGLATANVVWGNKASVLVGDFLFSRAFQLMVSVGSLEVLDILSNAAATIAEGEVLQLTTVSNPETEERDYLRVVDGKTAALFAAATRVAAIIANRPAEDEAAVDEFGRNLGMAFQLVDDVLDYSAHQATLGKTIGDDFREGKITLPVILAYRAADADERLFWQRTVSDLDQRPDDLDRAIHLMARHGALAQSLDRARAYAGVARRALLALPDRPERQALLDVVDFCVERAY